MAPLTVTGPVGRGSSATRAVPNRFPCRTVRHCLERDRDTPRPVWALQPRICRFADEDTVRVGDADVTVLFTDLVGSMCSPTVVDIDEDRTKKR